MGGSIFISYRRNDSQGSAGRLFDRLAATFGMDHVFMDVDSIDPGAHFPTVLSAKLAESDVLIAVIGPQWFGRDATGARRLDHPEDFVHQEIAGALERGIRVVPVLVEGAAMPTVAQLPPTLARLAGLQAAEVRHARFNIDAKGLTEKVQQALAAAEVARGSQPLPEARAWLREVLGEPAGWEDIIFGPPEGAMISTFYSYKDGVGRTMALANIGELLREAGLRVLLVDLDLEGPSLDRYFSRQDQAPERPGFMDLVAAYKEALLDPGLPARAPTSRSVLDDFEIFLSAVPSGPSSLGQLFVMSTGRLDAQYLARIQEFDWRDFYTRWEGELFFRWLRGQFAERFDVTLVDVRAGTTPTGSIGCYQVADVVICFCGPRQREALGLSAMLEGFLRREAVEKRQVPLRVLVVPSRIDDAEMQRLDDLRRFFRSTFARVVPEGLSIDDMWRASVPNVAYYANQDASLVNPQSAAGERLLDSYRRVAALLCRIAPPESRLADAYEAVRGRPT